MWLAIKFATNDKNNSHNKSCNNEKVTATYHAADEFHKISVKVLKDFSSFSTLSNLFYNDVYVKYDPVQFW